MNARPVAIVTGASRGIGRAVAIALGAAGYGVTVNYARSAEPAREAVAEIIRSGGDGIAVRASVADAADRHTLVDQTLQRFGRIDLLVNNAGITSQGRKDVLEATEASWNIVFDTNLKGPFFLSQLVAKAMVKTQDEGQLQRGTIINISSISAFAVSTNRADYCMTKAALRMMTLLFATRLADHQIRVYEICPGIIATDMTAAVQEKYDRLIADGLTPIRRWGQPSDIAKAVLALTSDQFPFSTGDRIHVDGGFHIRQL